MALHISITPPILKMNERHVKTIVELSASDTMEPVMERYVLTGKELLNKTVNIELTKGEKYYLTARFVFDPGGYQGVSAPVMFVPTDSKDTVAYIYPPKDNPPPIPNDPYDFYPPGFFYTPSLDLSNIEDTVESVSWVLEDIDSNVNFYLGHSREFVDRVLVDRFIMPDTLYILKCSATFKNGNTTLLSSKFLRTGSLDGEIYKILKVRYCNESRLDITTSKPLGFKHNKVKITNIRGETMFEFVTDETITLDSTTITEKMMIVSLTCETIFGTTYGPIFYYATLSPDPRLPYCIPYPLMSD